MHSQIRAAPILLHRRGARAIVSGIGGGRRKLYGKCAMRGWRTGVKPSAHVAKARVSPGQRSVYLACIHMQIPIDMTTFTYCIFALGHILARQFPIVGFRPPVRLIDIIGRAADTRLHFYLHTFANQFEPTRSSMLAFSEQCPPVPPAFRYFSFRSRADDWTTIFVLEHPQSLRPTIRVSYFCVREMHAMQFYPLRVEIASGELGDGGTICYVFRMLLRHSLQSAIEYE